MKKQFNIRLEESTIEKFREKASSERQKTGYKITVTAIVEKVLNDFIENEKE